MPATIVKRDGRIVNYDETKIKEAILKATIHAATPSNPQELQHDQAIALVKRITRQLDKEYPFAPPMIEDIQEVVIQHLIQNKYVETSKAYILYRQKRTQMRSRKSDVMNTIRDITYSSSKDSDLKRENANIDGNTAMGAMLQYGSTISKEFSLNDLIDPLYAQMHRDGDIHIHDLDFYAIGTLTCCQIPLKKLLQNGFHTGHGFLRQPQDIYSYAALAAIIIQSNQNDQHGGQSFPAFDYDMAEGVEKTYQKAIRSLLSQSLRYAGLEFQIQLNTTEVSIEDENKTKRYLENMLQEAGLDAAAFPRMVKFILEEASQQTEQKTHQAMEAFLHNLNTMHSRAGAQIPFSSINYGTDTSKAGRMVTKHMLQAIANGLGNHETAIFPISIFKVKEGVNYQPQDPNYDLFELACKVSAKRLFPNFSFLDAPFNQRYLQQGNPYSEVAYMGCRTRVIANVCGEETVDGRGNLSFTTINLPRLGLEHQNRIDDFFLSLDERVKQCIAQLLERFELQGQKSVMNFPFLMGQGIWRNSETLANEDKLSEIAKQGTLSIGFIGLAECLMALTGSHHGQTQEAQTLGIQIIQRMRQLCDEASQQYAMNITLLATPAEGLAGRFTKLDKHKYGVVKGVTDKDYYTNSFHVPVTTSITAHQKIVIEAPYHALTNAGHITYVEMNGDLNKNPLAFMQLIKLMKEAGIGYGSINHPVDHDSQCGYHGIIDGPICPQCQRNEEEDGIPFSRIRRITGYLVGTLDRFNHAKRMEEKDRVKHA